MQLLGYLHPSRAYYHLDINQPFGTAHSVEYWETTVDSLWEARYLCYINNTTLVSIGHRANSNTQPDAGILFPPGGLLEFHEAVLGKDAL